MVRLSRHAVGMAHVRVDAMDRFPTLVVRTVIMFVTAAVAHDVPRHSSRSAARSGRPPREKTMSSNVGTLPTDRTSSRMTGEDGTRLPHAV